MACQDERGPIIIEDDATQTGAHADSGERTDHQNSALGESCPGVSTDPGCQEEPSSLAGRRNPVHAVGSTSTEPGLISETANQSSQDGPALPGATGHASKRDGGAAVPCSTHQGAGHDHTLAATDVTSGRRLLPSDAAPGSVPSLASDWSKHAPAQRTTELLGTSSRDQHGSLQGTGKGQVQEQAGERADPEEGDLTQDQLMAIVSHMTLANPSNWCFGNAAVYSLLWTVLSLVCFTPSFWGTQCNLLMDFLTRAKDQMCNLSHEQFFREILHCWGREAIGQLSYQISQQDASEFVHAWLGHLQTPAFQMRWEKRISLAESVQVMDQGLSSHAPICLKFDTLSAQCEFCSVTSLLSTWHQVDGMTSALLQASPCICAHIDRGMMDQDLRIYKCVSKLRIDDECLVPVFQDGTIECEFHSYTTVALMSHIGSDGSGHYRAALKLQATVLNGAKPVCWLTTDDWRCPEAAWTPPTWLHENVTLVWLVRTDLLRQHLFRPKQDQTSTNMAELMQLLTQANDRM